MPPFPPILSSEPPGCVSGVVEDRDLHAVVDVWVDEAFQLPPHLFRPSHHEWSSSRRSAGVHRNKIRFQVRWLTYWLIDWLFNWLFDSLIDWLIEWMDSELNWHWEGTDFFSFQKDQNHWTRIALNVKIPTALSNVNACSIHSISISKSIFKSIFNGIHVYTWASFPRGFIW